MQTALDTTACYAQGPHSSPTAVASSAAATSAGASTQGAQESKLYSQIGTAAQKPLDELKLSAPTGKVELLKETRFMLMPDWGELPAVSVIQFQINESDVYDRRDIENSSEDLPVQRDAYGNAYVTVRPLRTGKIEFSFLGKYPSGKFAIKRIIADVVLSSDLPTNLVVDLLRGTDRGETAQSLTLSGSRSERTLGYYAKFPDYKDYIQLQPSDVLFNIYSSGNAKVVEINPETGRLKALGLGHALLKVGYGSLQYFVCVTVSPPTDRVELKRSKCEDLLQSGEQLGRNAP